VTVAAGLSPARVLLSLLAACGLALSGWTAFGHAADPAPPAPANAKERRHAELELRAAADTLTQAHRLVGTYAETDLKVFRGLVLVSAGEHHYCIEVYGIEGGVYRLAGPRGRVAPGRCART
jgi:hypothetical protein